MNKKWLTVVAVMFTSIAGKAQQETTDVIERTPVIRVIHSFNKSGILGFDMGGSFALNSKISLVTLVGIEGEYGEIKKENGTKCYHTKPNSGIYRIGTWGNNLTGNNKSWEVEGVKHPYNVGALISLKKYFTKPINLYVTLGKVNQIKYKEYYLEAEDISSGYNVLGYYTINGGSDYSKNQALNTSIGILVDANPSKPFSFNYGMYFSYNKFEFATLNVMIGYCF